MSDSLPVFIGWDSREEDAARVAAYSIKKHTSISVDVQFLKIRELVDRGLYWRPSNEPASTEFTYSRFLVPYLCRFRGPALFFDCDFLWTGDVADLLRECIPFRGRALYCVKHDHKPTELTKMDGQRQVVYPRKNWSSLMFFNCGHRSTRRLTVEAVNSLRGDQLHRMTWAKDWEIGELPETWNWLEGWSSESPDTPKAIHFTRGGPWFPGYENVRYADLWLRTLDEAKREVN